MQRVLIVLGAGMVRVVRGGGGGAPDMGWDGIGCIYQ